MKFIIFHGSYGSPDENWFPQLKNRLEELGQEVIVPKFPVEDWNEITKKGQGAYANNQNLTNWFKTFETVLKSVKKSDKLCFVGHSLGPLFILHAVQKYNIMLDSAIFISPFLRDIHKDWQFYVVCRTFYDEKLDFEKLKKLIPVSYVLYSDTDPYVSPDFALEFGSKLKSSTILVKNAGHMNSEVNLNEFPLVLELCKTRLDLSLYQRFLEHKGMTPAEFMKANKGKVMHYPASELGVEGSFHFRHLRKRGFCTLLTGIKLWDNNSTYMEDCRTAAKRIKDLTRVFVISDINDLKKEHVLNQIDLDLTAGIKIYLIMAKDIKDITPEPDFGIWDDEYVCIVSPNKYGEVDDIKLTSRKEELASAQNWEKEILKLSTRILTNKDVELYIKQHI